MTKKQKIKKLKLPLNKMTGNEKDYAAVLLEDVNSNMKAFWEVVSSNQDDIKSIKNDIKNIKEKGDATWDILQSVKEKCDATFEQAGIITERLVSVEFKLDDLMKEISFIKEEIKSLKVSLSAKADKEKLAMLEFKIVRIEKYLKLVQ